MITLKGYTGNLEGLSTDQKPTDVPVNTEFRELDTNCRFYFTGESWEEIPSSGGGGGSGTSNYNELENKPQIAGVTLSGNKTLANLGIQGELSFDNAPTEDSTNPVTSGGVYEALQAKQDTLTIDDTPTEDSTNPVTSGGVYSALEDKQDNLVFEGTYNSSTNKAATESTVSDAVSTAIGNLSKSDVGLDNVTNNTQIKALSGSVTSGGIVTFGNDGATVSDSGKTIETNLSNSNDNVPTSKAVRDKVAGSATMASNYTTDSSESSITSASTINDAIEQLDYRTVTNKNNILLSEQMNGAKNLIKFDGLSRTSHNGVNFTLNSDLSVTITRVESSSSTATVELTLNGNYVYIDSYCDGQHYLTGCPNGGGSTTYESLAKESGASNYIRRDYGNGVQLTDRSTYSNILYQIAVRSGFTGSVTFKPMIITKSAYDAGFTDYQPYALPNTAITPALKECVDKGAKNLYKFEDLGATAGSGTGVTLTSNGDGTFTATGTASGANYARYLLKQATIKTGTYVISGISGGSLNTYRLRVGTGSGDAYLVNLEDDSAKFTITSDTTITIQFVVNSGVTVTNLSIKPMICTEAEYKASQTYQPYAMSNVELTNIAVPLSGKTVLNVQANTSQTATYQMLGADFGDKRSCGVYLIYIVSWGTSPVLSVYAAYYSGGVTTYSAITKIAGADATVSVSGDTISVTSSGKIQIIAVQ